MFFLGQWSLNLLPNSATCGTSTLVIIKLLRVLRWSNISVILFYCYHSGCHVVILQVWTYPLGNFSIRSLLKWMPGSQLEINFHNYIQLNFQWSLISTTSAFGLAPANSYHIDFWFTLFWGLILFFHYNSLIRSWNLRCGSGGSQIFIHAYGGSSCGCTCSQVKWDL